MYSNRLRMVAPAQKASGYHAVPGGVATGVQEYFCKALIALSKVARPAVAQEGATLQSQAEKENDITMGTYERAGKNMVLRPLDNTGRNIPRQNCNTIPPSLTVHELIKSSESTESEISNQGYHAQPFDRDQQQLQRTQKQIPPQRRQEKMQTQVRNTSSLYIPYHICFI